MIPGLIVNPNATESELKEGFGILLSHVSNVMEALTTTMAIDDSQVLPESEVRGVCWAFEGLVKVLDDMWGCIHRGEFKPGPAD